MNLKYVQILLVLLIVIGLAPSAVAAGTAKNSNDMVVKDNTNQKTVPVMGNAVNPDIFSKVGDDYEVNYRYERTAFKDNEGHETECVSEVCDIKKKKKGWFS